MPLSCRASGVIVHITAMVSRVLGGMSSSTKSMTGHLLGAAGGIESVFSVLALQNNVLPPTINYVNPDPECDLDYVPNEPREARVEYVLSNSFGFGGTNAALLFKRYEG